MTSDHTRSLRIAMVVHGRFHAFDLARALLQRGHAVTLFTHHPAWAAQRYGVPDRHVVSAGLLGILDLVATSATRKGLCRYPEAQFHQWFGHWAARYIAKKEWDVALCWSGVGEEVFRTLGGGRALRVCHRTSAHIRTQARLLQEESCRVGTSIDGPSAWIIEREEREYRLADVMCVPSTFVKQTFLREGVRPEKIGLVRLGVNVAAFRPPQDIIEARHRRLRSGEPLRVLTVGAISFRKGLWDMAQIIRTLAPEGFQFRFVGQVEPAVAKSLSDLPRLATFIPSQPQRLLPNHLAWGDVFLSPTIEDGFQLVLAQAAAAGLPILTTAHGAGTDLVEDTVTGWVLPIRQPETFIQQLRWCDAHRQALVEMSRNTYEVHRQRDWADVARDFERFMVDRLPR